MMKVCIVLGTRPEIIKMSPLIRECKEQGIDFFVIHSGQHYSIDMDAVFFEDLKLDQPKYNLEVGSGKHGEQTAKILTGIENILLEEKPDVVLVQGDTNTVLAGALAASKLKIKVGHVEAGLRSYDWDMPEEINRIIADHISDILFVPTQKSEDIASKEGLKNPRVQITGNTVVDALYQNLEIAKSKDFLTKYDVTESNFALVTLHRPSNVDDPEKLARIIDAIVKVHDMFDGFKLLWPVHPRTRKQVEILSKDKFEGKVELIDPIGYLEFISLLGQARFVMTDSGGVQEESCILGTPCITLRENTERPETIDVGGNILVGNDPEKLIKAVEFYENNPNLEWENPFGDGTTSKQILEHCREIIKA